MAMHLVIDLDQTLLNTSQLKPYRATREGREFITQNPYNVPSSEYHQALKDIVHHFARHNAVSVITNSLEENARALLTKHGFPTLKIFGSAGKPSSASLQQLITSTVLSPQKILMIGDSPTDIIAAHNCEVTSFAALWGSSFSRKHIAAAEPSFILESPDELEKKLIEFDQGKISYKQPQRSEKFEIHHPDVYTPEITFLELGTYHPWGSLGFVNGGHSDRILRFKKAKDFTIDAINKGATDDFFYNGKVRKGGDYKSAIIHFAQEVQGMLKNTMPDEQGLEGTTLLVAAPNSKPEYCYITDINQILLHNAKTGLTGIQHDDRWLYRVHPKLASHEGGGRNVHGHYNTVGVRRDIPLLDVDNIVLFDDIRTSGSQLTAMASILRAQGFEGRFYALTLGHTL
jgi:hypothetical protein